MRLKNFEITEIAGKQVVIKQGEFAVDMTKIIAFNNTALNLWMELKDKEFTREDVVSILLNSFNIEQEVAERDANVWIDQCISADLIEN